jgi:AcrR family transcriptional regulator
MITQMSKRKYKLKKRAVKKRRTRDRIVEATVALHQELGPQATTISGIAERAGVQRLTVYRHFPTERDLLGACSSSFIAQHPPPAPDPDEGLGADEQTRSILEAFYRYYQETSEMWAIALCVGAAPFKAAACVDRPCAAFLHLAITRFAGSQCPRHGQISEHLGGRECIVT